ncbi:DUF6114 domain-containing protein [Kitasatospora cinereorecta]|uniref:DUF6114 domain-containing protein n=1 Tax=Kitasatospora cinereorecta TaxID=285560 RepID=A0ABW0VQY8_9ACTN
MSSATAEAFPEPVRTDGKFRAWRRTRPFWGGLLAMIAGVPILYLPYAHLSLNGMSIAMSTTAGAGSLIIGILIIALGLTVWFQPLVRIFCGVATSVLALVSIPVSNLGGFGLGLIPGLIAGGLMVAWAPLPVVEAVPADGTAETTATAEMAAEQTVPLPTQSTTAPLATEPGEQK